MLQTNGYVHPEVLVSTAWAMDNLSKPRVRFVEVDVDTTHRCNEGQLNE
jgi:hypothetical protein